MDTEYDDSEMELTVMDEEFLLGQGVGNIRWLNSHIMHWFLLKTSSVIFGEPPSHSHCSYAGPCRKA